MDRAVSDDATLLGAMPDFLCISQMLKSTPKTEGNERFVYLEAANEALDLQHETVLAKALEDSSGYFKQYGNIDLDHISKIGLKLNIPNYELYEIGRPVEVSVRGAKTFVKAHIMRGDGPVAEKANMFWDSQTKVQPPHRWYPSVAGQILEKGVDLDPKTHMRKGIIKRVRWNNIGFSKTPVNPEVPTVSTIPFGALCKSMGPTGFDFSKALEAGYGTDAAALVGGGALRKQSLYGTEHGYFDYREHISAAMSARRLGANPGASDMHEFSMKEFGLSHDESAEYVERFMSDIHSGLKGRSH